jgi:hypothetical protein
MTTAVAIIARSAKRDAAIRDNDGERQIMPDTTLQPTEARLLQALRARGEAKRAEWEQRYQKSR